MRRRGWVVLRRVVDDGALPHHEVVADGPLSLFPWPVTVPAPPAGDRRRLSERMEKAAARVCDDETVVSAASFDALHVRAPCRSRRIARVVRCLERWGWVGWHVDLPLVPYVGILHCTDVCRGGGGTRVVPGSHRIVARCLPWLRRMPSWVWAIVCHAIAWSSGPHEEVCADAGDLVLFDGLLVHAVSCNTRGTRPRLTYRVPFLRR